jgi:hypothetical protein
MRGVIGIREFGAANGTLRILIIVLAMGTLFEPGEDAISAEFMAVDARRDFET